MYNSKKHTGPFLYWVDSSPVMVGTSGQPGGVFLAGYHSCSNEVSTEVVATGIILYSRIKKDYIQTNLTDYVAA